MNTDRSGIRFTQVRILRSWVAPSPLRCESLGQSTWSGLVSSKQSRKCQSMSDSSSSGRQGSKALEGLQNRTGCRGLALVLALTEWYIFRLSWRIIAAHNASKGERISCCKELSVEILFQVDTYLNQQKGRDCKIERYYLKHFLTYLMALLLQLAEKVA